MIFLVYNVFMRNWIIIHILSIMLASFACWNTQACDSTSAHVRALFNVQTNISAQYLNYDINSFFAQAYIEVDEQNDRPLNFCFRYSSFDANFPYYVYSKRIQNDGPTEFKFGFIGISFLSISSVMRVKPLPLDKRTYDVQLIFPREVDLTRMPPRISSQKAVATLVLHQKKYPQTSWYVTDGQASLDAPGIDLIQAVFDRPEDNHFLIKSLTLIRTITDEDAITISQHIFP